MKKIVSILLSAIMISCFFTGCKTKENKKLTIVTTIFPCYDWTREILGEKAQDVELTFLLNNGTDLHSFQPTAGDLTKIAKSDLFVYVGGESDEWVENALKSVKNKNLEVINMMSVLKKSVLEEETVEGMQIEEEGEEEEEEETEYDEHVWLSFNKASVICDEICKHLCKIDGENADIYKENTEKYKNKLNALNEEYKKTVEGSSAKTLIFADRFPFRYLTEDFGLKYYAAFSGCSSETEATFKTIAFLSEKLISEKLKSIMIIEGSNKDIAKKVIETSKLENIKIIELNSMQIATLKNGKSKDTYISLAEKNLKAIKEALN